MDTIRFEAVGTDNLNALVHITRETLWQPAWPGDEAVARDFRRWPPALQQDTLLIFAGGELVGRVVAPQLGDVGMIRDLGLRAGAELASQVARALLQRAEQHQARTVRVIVFAPWWPAFASLDFGEQKRRVTMQIDPSRDAPPASRIPSGAGRTVGIRNITDDDIAEIGETMAAAYRGTVDDEGEDQAQWTDHTSDVVAGQYGRFLPSASFVMPVSPPFHSATLLIETAPRCAILAQVVTRRSQTNCGHARRLVSRSLAALAALDYQRCFLEVTLTNANAMHLYRSLGFVEIGPQIVYGVKQVLIE